MSRSTDQNLGSVLTWARSLFSRFVSGSLIFGTIFAVASVPVLLVIGTQSELAASFGWLGIVGMSLWFLTIDLSDESEEAASQIEGIEDKRRFILLYYLFSYLLILVGAIGITVGVSGILAAFLFQQTGVGLLGIAVAIFYPAIDFWIGQRSRFSVAVIGAMIAYWLLWLLSLTQMNGNGSSSLLRAGKSARSMFVTHEPDL